MGDDGGARWKLRIGANHAIAAGDLRLVERRVGAGEKLVNRIPWARFADTHAPGERDRALGCLERLRGEPLAERLGDLDGLRQFAAFEDERELIAAEPPG